MQFGLLDGEYIGVSAASLANYLLMRGHGRGEDRCHVVPIALVADLQRVESVNRRYIDGVG